jgi:hypothetical protein
MRNSELNKGPGVEKQSLLFSTVARMQNSCAWQLFVQKSKLSTFPSSHCSDESTTPSPHTDTWMGINALEKFVDCLDVRHLPSVISKNSPLEHEMHFPPIKNFVSDKQDEQSLSEGPVQLLHEL